ncbi:MAG: hypothetical protein L0177_14120, partial [Chloroflexi bacterium]|nr:hypothetical protein [Chloroflexota bacterium]
MRWQFWQHSEQAKIPDRIRRTLAVDFKLDPQYMDELRHMERSGKFSNRKAKHVRVYDPALVASTPKRVQRYEDLDNHTEAILFEGHIDRFGAFLKDRRPK